MRTSHPDRVEQLRALLSKRTKAVSDRMLADGGHIAELEELEQLSRLLKLTEAAEPRVKKRWPVAAALAATLLIVSVLLFAHVPSTEIELDLLTSEARFVVPTQQVLTEDMSLAAVGMAGLSSIELPRPLEAVRSDSAGGAEAIRISAAAAGARAGSVNLNALTVLPGTSVGIQVLDGTRSYRLSLRGADANRLARVGVLGPTTISLAGTPTKQVDFPTPRSIVLRSNADDVFIDLTSAETAPSFRPLLPVSQLILFRVDEYPDGERSIIRRVSSILSGTLFLESLKGRELMLRPGQPLQFDAVNGEIRSLRLAEDHIALKLHGRVRGMRTGSGTTERSLMPTWLEWLYARHGISLLWGTTLYIFGIGAAVLRWWRQGGD